VVAKKRAEVVLEYKKKKSGGELAAERSPEFYDL